MQGQKRKRSRPSCCFTLVYEAKAWSGLNRESNRFRVLDWRSTHLAAIQPVPTNRTGYSDSLFKKYVITRHHYTQELC